MAKTMRQLKNLAVHTMGDVKSVLRLLRQFPAQYVPMAGLEPATFGLEVRRAIQLRHTGSSGNRFRSYDLRVMGPTRFLCATPL